MTSIDGLVSSDKFKEMLPWLFVEQFKIVLFTAIHHKKCWSSFALNLLLVKKKKQKLALCGFTLKEKDKKYLVIYLTTTFDHSC